MAGLLALDTLLLTLLLGLSGGAANPFAPLYLLVVALAAMVVRPAWTWMLVGFATAAYASLFALPAPAHAHHVESMTLHLAGMWVAFVLGAPFLAYATLRLRDEVMRARAAGERASRLASLATLAAGAAHELATPLGTIAVIAGEWERSPDDRVRADADLLRREVGRCRDIVADLSASAGAGMGEAPANVALAALLEEAVEGRAVRIDAGGIGAVRVPARLVRQVLHRLLENALAASPDVSLRASAEGDVLVLTVEDRGPGMPADVLARAGEPFFTTRPTGKGRGLGLFFARSVVDHLGGTLVIRSSPGQGTAVVARLPGAIAGPS